MSAKITKLPIVAKLASKPAYGVRARSRAFQRRMRRQALAASGIGAVAFILTALSLTHLAHGIAIVTAAPAWEAWAMAIGIDLGFIGLELATICAATDSVRKQIGKFARPAILGTLTASALMNAFAFATGGTDVASKVVAVCLGIAVPALIYALMRIGAAMWLNCDRA